MLEHQRRIHEGPLSQDLLEASSIGGTTPSTTDISNDHPGLHRTDDSSRHHQYADTSQFSSLTQNSDQTHLGVAHSEHGNTTTQPHDVVNNTPVKALRAEIERVKRAKEQARQAMLSFDRDIDHLTGALRVLE